MKNLVIIGLASLALGLVAACGAAAPTAAPTAAPSAAPSAAPTIVDLEIGTGVITPANVDVTRGSTVTFRATNVSDTEVELIVGLAPDVAADAGDSLKEAEEIAPGQTKEVTYTFDGDGPYAYADQIGDHYAAGAKGTITLVSSAGSTTVDLEIGTGVITPANVDVKKGATVTFRAKNVSDTEVELIVGLAPDVAADSGDSLKEAEEIAPGQTKEVTYTFDGDGPYAYADQIGDHYAAGAKGTITLVP